MNRILKFLVLMAALFSVTILSAQTRKKTTKNEASNGTSKKVESAEAPKRIDPAQATEEIVERIYNYLSACTPYELVDADDNTISDFNAIDNSTSFKKGDFGISTYEWGVTYSGFLKAADVLGVTKYSDYVYERLKFLGKVYPYVKNYYDETGYQMRLNALHTPKWLDDCGAMTAAMIKATLADPRGSREFRQLLDNWFDFVMYKEYRFGNGILARNRPTTNSVWLDDMYMGITPIAYRGKLSQSERGDLTQKYYNEAINQVLLFKKYLWIPEKNLYRHGWIEGMSEHPSYHWARANGWAVLTMCDVLDAVPENVQGRDEVLELLCNVLRGIAAYQSPEGTWHQLIDKTESYLETSASAMFVYGFAHAVNQGWLDKTAYQDIAKAGWNAVMRQVNEMGQVENTCVGTGLGWTNTFYEGRPVSVYAAHGYGPVLLAAAEMIKLYRGGNRIPYYSATVSYDKPMLFLAGDSTCKNGSGTGSNGQWGWGSFFNEYVNDGIIVENDAVGGLSSRTFFNNNWGGIRDRIKKGDYVIIQFGHNDMSALGTGRARGTVSGTSDQPTPVVMEKNGATENVYSYGHYVRMMVRQTKIRGGIPVIVSPTPQNSWGMDGKVRRFTDTYNAWCRRVAEEEACEFVDFNVLAAERFDALGKEVSQSDYFSDSVHTKEKGARLYCDILAEALKDTSLGQYVK